MGQFNTLDPRFQRDMQRAAAKRLQGPGRLARSDIGRITSFHTGKQLDTQLQFGELAARKKLSDLRSEHRDKYLNLERKRLRFREREFEKDLDDEKFGLRYTIASGIGLAALSTIEGQRRKRAIQKAAEEKRMFRHKLLAAIDRSIPASSIGFYATEEEQ